MGEVNLQPCSQMIRFLHFSKVLQVNPNNRKISRSIFFLATQEMHEFPLLLQDPGRHIFLTQLGEVLICLAPGMLYEVS